MSTLNKKRKWRTTINHVGSTDKHWKLSEETKIKMSEVQKGKTLSEETKEKIRRTLTGRKREPFSEETLKKLSLARKRYFANGGISPMGMLGRKASPETIKKLSDSHKGKPVPNRQGNKSSAWKGGVTSIHETIRNSLDYRNWRQAIFERDSFECKLCGNNKGGNLRAHHIQNFANYPELRFELNNGITLCNDCHGEFHKQYGRQNTTKEQFKEFRNQKFTQGWTESENWQIPGWNNLKEVLYG